MLPAARVVSSLRGQVAGIKVRQQEGEEYIDYMPIEKKLESTLEKLQLAEKELTAHKRDHGYLSPRARPNPRDDGKWKLSPPRRHRRRAASGRIGRFGSMVQPSASVPSLSSAQWQAPPTTQGKKRMAAPEKVQTCLFGPISHSYATLM